MKRKIIAELLSATVFSTAAHAIKQGMQINMLKIRRSALAAALMLGASFAQADVVYNFTSTQVNNFGTGPYGSVTLSQNGANMNFTVDLRSDLNFVNTGGPHSIFSFNAIGVVATDISNILFNGVADPNVTAVMPGVNQPFGTTFSLMLDCTVAGNCPNGAPGQHFDPLTFTIANATYSDFGFLNPGTTAFFAADVISSTGATGAIGAVNPGTPFTRVPEPASVSLLGLGLGLLGLTASRRRRG